MIGVSRTRGRGCGLGGVGAARRHYPLPRNRTHPGPLMALQQMLRVHGLPQHPLSSPGWSWLPQKNVALPLSPNLQLCVFFIRRREWTLRSPELVSSRSSARSRLPTISLLQTSPRLHSSYFPPPLPPSSPLLTKLAQEGGKRHQGRDIFCFFLLGLLLSNVASVLAAQGLSGKWCLRAGSLSFSPFPAVL